MSLHIPDLSEWQATVDIASMGPAGIFRAHNGYRADHTFAARQAESRKHQSVRGFYGYVAASRDAATQGREFANVVGKLLPNEFAVCDLEEGTGDQSPRALAWMAEVDRLCGGRAWLYTGLSFKGDHLAHITGRNLWVAAYRNAEPGLPHVLWQHTSSATLPGCPGKVDCSIFKGTLADLRKLVTPGPAPTRPRTPKPNPYAVPRIPPVIVENHKTPPSNRVRYVQWAVGTGVDGRFWQGTAQAVAAFQRKHGLTPDSIVGPQTLAALRKVTR